MRNRLGKLRRRLASLDGEKALPAHDHKPRLLQTAVSLGISDAQDKIISLSDLFRLFAQPVKIRHKQKALPVEMLSGGRQRKMPVLPFQLFYSQLPLQGLNLLRDRGLRYVTLLRRLAEAAQT